MKHGEQLAPLIAARPRVAGVRPPGPDRDRRRRRARDRSPVCGSAWSPRARSASPRHPGPRRVHARRARGQAIAPARSRRPSSSPRTRGARRSTGRRTTRPARGSTARTSTAPADVGPRTRWSGRARCSTRVVPARGRPDAPSAGWLARAVAGELAELLDPEPLYLRRPDAVAPGPPQGGLVIRPAAATDVAALLALEADAVRRRRLVRAPRCARADRPGRRAVVLVDGRRRGRLRRDAAGRRRRRPAADRRAPRAGGSGLAALLLADVLAEARSDGATGCCWRSARPTRRRWRSTPRRVRARSTGAAATTATAPTRWSCARPLREVASA